MTRVLPRSLETQAGHEPASDLRQVIDEIVQQVTARLGAGAGTLGECSATPVAKPGCVVPAIRFEPRTLAKSARCYLKMRRDREQRFAPEIFGEPAWDLLLDLFASEVEGRPISVSSACIAAAVPPTTALRWIATLQKHGLIVRHPDPDDGRRAFLKLEPTAKSAIGDWLAATFGGGAS